MISRTLKSTKIIGVPKSEFSRGEKGWGIHGGGEEGKRGKRVTGPEGEGGGKNEGKTVGGKGPKAHSKTLILVPRL